MKSVRLEAFSDGVIAIIITIMVLELKTPHGTTMAELGAVLPEFLRYLLSFLYIGIYWVNHHALFEGAKSINAAVLWANLHLLFWLSLIPFVTAWAGEHPLDAVPLALYGAVLLMCSFAYATIAGLLHGRQAVSGDRKNLASLALYALAIPMAAWYAPAASLIHVMVALLWLVPDTGKDLP
jgi:uncharacterized membrane protein